jgi:transposase
VRREQVREAIERDPESVVDLVMSLQERIEELDRRLDQDSRNSSKPPSSDPPKSRAERRREARGRAKEWSKRKPGAQPGHEGKTREMAPPERVDETFEHLPERCRCGHAFEGTEEPVGEPVAHQEWELPPARPLVIEHRRARLACPGCGKANLAILPPGVTPSAFGPRLEAHIATLAGVFRLSRRQVRRVVEEMLGVPISTGAVDAAIMRMSEALADPWKALRKAVREAEAVNADETGWRMAGAGQWLWLGASALAACYRIDPTRSQAAAKELLGEDFGGIVVSDRYAAYHFLDVLQQQLCWCHLARQFTELSERSGVSGRRGAELVAASREVFAAHRRYLAEGRELAWLRTELEPLRGRIRALLEQGARGRNRREANICAGLLAEYEALWTFCEVPDVTPTNNTAERALRHAVIMRKVQGGTQSEQGSRWIERILSVNETCRLQGRVVLDYLVEAAVAAHHGRSAPSPLPP